MKETRVERGGGGKIGARQIRLLGDLAEAQMFRYASELTDPEHQLGMTARQMHGVRANIRRSLPLRKGSGLPGGSGQSALICILKAMWTTGRNPRRGSPWINGRLISVATDLKLVSYRLEFGVAGGVWAGDN